ncbi:hypothetical protein ACHAP1_006801 [Verticillium nonalfalfae]
MVGMPYYREPLLSAWPDMVSDVGAPPPTLDPQFLSTLKATEFGLYGPNTRGLRRNQVEDTRKTDKTTVTGIQAPKFLSEKARESSKTPGQAAGAEDEVDDAAAKMAGDRKTECPPMYRNVEIKYSKFGVDDFDFGYYNRTAYSGLEIHIANSYANALLQVMHFTPLIRNLALQHTATACIVETCLLCELGFLFDMLEKAEGSICQATNLLKALSHQPQGFLPEEIGVIVDHGQFFCYEGEDLKLHLQRGIHNITVYSLIGMTMEVEAGPGQKPHMVGMINVGHCQPEAPEASQWHLFNDFLVRSVSKEEALSFNANWKIPSVLTFQVKEANNMMDTTWKQKIDTSLLFTDSSHLHDSKTYRTLDGATEPPGPGSIIALDTEFVAVRQPEIEMNSEGERETIRPKVYALARTSVIRGEGEAEGEPFVDDYILIREPIVDYLTAFSGITEVDLNPRLSKHNLVPLKVAYKKLWMLVNLGCKFLGHGLKQDFRVINIHIPKAQVIDTIELYYLHTRLRKLSLAFLAWIVLRENIQNETHDSIEDSRTALRLYRKYQEPHDTGQAAARCRRVVADAREGIAVSLSKAQHA